MTGAGGLARFRALAEGIRDRVAGTEGFVAREEDGGVLAIARAGTDVARLVPSPDGLRVDYDARRAPTPAARRLGRPHRDAALARVGWRSVEVENRRRASDVVRALRSLVGDEAGGRRAGDLRVGRVRVRRLRDAPTPEDGARVLVDAFWPRGVPRAAPPFEAWEPDAAPSRRLSEAFGDAAGSTPAFRRAYLAELRASAKAETVSRLRARLARGSLTLLTVAPDLERSSAAVLAHAVSLGRTPRHMGRVRRAPARAAPPARRGGRPGAARD